jgi:hypothetical protein
LGPARQAIEASLLPELAGDLQGVDPGRLPPAEFAARAVEFPVVGAAERDGELVADLAAERADTWSLRPLLEA